MKLRRLDLLRYGHLADVALDFPPDATLHVVHGANEAGKSTALAAIADALFGFGNRTNYDFLHGGPQLRIGFTLAAQDGTQAAFVRRKGRRDTLRDDADGVIPEDALRRFLGGASRELFERGFGLDGERLRQGGMELLRSGGEAGESLLAGAGLLNLRAALTKLDDAAKTLVGDGRGRRVLSEAVERWRSAHRASDERAIAPRVWQEADAAYTEAVEALARVQADTGRLAAEDSRLQRVRRVAPLLARLDAARAEFSTLADAPVLPADAEARRQRALAERREAARDAERETAEAARLTALRAALAQDAVVLAVQDRIDALAVRRPVVVQAIADLPEVRTKIATYRAGVADALRDLGLSLSPDAARERVPPASIRREMHKLMQQRSGLNATTVSAHKILEAARRGRDLAAASLAAAPAAPDPALLRRTIEAVRAEGPLDAEVERRTRARDDAAAATASALAALPLWSGDIAALVASPLPLPAEADAVAARMEAAEKALADARATAARLVAEMATVDEDLSRLARGETMPTPGAVAAARSTRDRAWRLVRRAFDGGELPDETELAGLPDGPLPDGFEILLADADRLADRRADEAQRVADFLAATARRSLLADKLAEANAALGVQEAATVNAEAAWRALWVPARVVPDGPVAMKEWRRARTDVLKLAAAEAQMLGQCADAVARRERARASLTALLPDAVGNDTLAPLLLRAETACEAAEAALAAHRKCVDTLAREDARLPELEDAVRAGAAALAAWEQEWAVAVVELGLPPDASLDAAEAALGAWERIERVVPAWRSDEARVVDMEASVAAFGEAIRAVQERLAEAASEEPAPATAARLARRLGDARKAEAEAAALAGRITAHEAQIADAARRLRRADNELAALRRIACASDDGALERAIERARRRETVADEIARAEQALLAQGDGLAEEALRAEATAVDPDAVVARVAEIAAELKTLGERREMLSAERTRAEARLTELRDGHDAVSKAQEAEDALAEARAAAERYARLHVARQLLRFGIDRFREEQQVPLLRAAGAHFASLTGGRYVRLGVDQDTAGRALLHAVRDSGTECPVEALSEGTRDQLYLALRIATVDAHVAAAEPLPFIADDLLVHFDDVRAAAAITLLRELGRTTQVILFTHHDHIAALAAKQPGVAVQRLAAA